VRHDQLWQPVAFPSGVRYPSAFSARERQVLQFLARGVTNVQIAEDLGLSAGRVRNVVADLLNKLGVVDRTQAALLAYRYGLADVPRDGAFRTPLSSTAFTLYSLAAAPGGAVVAEAGDSGL
jgi:DNA-binding CsgD family transcriptional regulator